ncbi:MAG: hypothetical protein GX369_07565, partial [Euryarchaeota archaeon]|nr:hypothetical protein [Euryarchaeota archaeon]
MKGGGPVTPTLELTAEALDGKVKLTWELSDDSEDVSYYIVKCRQHGVLKLKENVDDGEEYTVEDLENDVTYTFTVTAVIGEKSIESNTVAATPFTISAPTAPRALEGDPGNREVTLTWKVPKSDGNSWITHYLIYQNGELIYGDDGEPIKPEGTSHTVTELENGEEYTFCVVAVNAAGKVSEKSEEIAVTPIQVSVIDGKVEVDSNGNVEFTDAEVEGTTVYLIDEDETAVKSVSINKDGTFKIYMTDVEAGKYTLEIVMHSYLATGDDFSFILDDNGLLKAISGDDEDPLDKLDAIIKVSVKDSIVEINKDEGTVGVEPTKSSNEGTSDNGITEGYITYDTLGEESLGTEVVIYGHLYGYADNEFSIMVKINGNNNDLIVAKGETDELGYFEVEFNFPTLPGGEYEIYAMVGENEIDLKIIEEGEEEIVPLIFTVLPGIIIENPVVTGPSILRIIATGFSDSDDISILLIDGTDALYGMNPQISEWTFNKNGVLEGYKESNPGFILPILEAGDYIITLRVDDEDYGSKLSIENVIADLEDLLGGIISEIRDGVAIIKTDLGEIQIALDELDAKIVDITDDMMLIIETELGEIQIALDELDAKIVDITDDMMLIIETELGEIQIALDE